MKMFIDLFEDAVKRNRSKTAIVADMGKRTVTYAELDLVFDFAALKHISSAGLRVLLTAQKNTNVLGTEMKIIGL